MPRDPRFRVPTEPLALGRLLRQMRLSLWLAFGLALVVHLGFSQLRGLEERQGVAKPLTTQFVKRQPRLTKPLELKKRPAPRRRPLQRRLIAVKAQAERRDAASHFEPTRIMRGLTRPLASVARAGLVGDFAVEPQALAVGVESSMRAKQTMDVSLELLDTEALDTGKYQAMVVQDPSDRRNVRGFFHLVIAYPLTMRNQSVAQADTRARIGIRRLVDALNRYTAIRADIGKTVTFDDETLLKIPWILLRTMSSFRLTGTEASNFGRYLTQGGFFCGTIGRSQQGVVPSYWGGLRPMVVDALNAVDVQYQRDWGFQIVPDEHPIYHCLFDFDGPAMENVWELGGGRYMEGVFYQGRLVAVVTRTDYAVGFADYGNPKSRYNEGNTSTRMVQFGVNTIIFALTQEGSITHRVMDMVAH